jgi:uncharacterized membrane protein YeaQ/YmgE (transglycosylase-associated protein family)
MLDVLINCLGAKYVFTWNSDLGGRRIIVGAIAKAIYPGHQRGGWLSALILGIIGSFIGGTIATLITTGSLTVASAGLNILGIVLSVIGALIAIFIWQQFAKAT